MKKFHYTLKTIYCPKSSGATTLLSADGSTVVSRVKRLPWKGGQNTSIVCSIDHQASIRMESSDCHRWSAMFRKMNFQPSWKQEKLSSGKAPGADAITAEVYKGWGLPMAEELTELFHCMCRKEAIP